MNKLSIYIHIPFCDGKCAYCSFISGNYNENIKHNYFQELYKEITHRAKELSNYEVDTIYIGGGTPSSVNEKYIQDIVLCIYSNYNICENLEFTIEANPCSITQEKLLIYKELGVNRLSIGIQSLNDKSLKMLGRKHNSKQAIDAINLAKKIGFDNVSCDFLIGIPNQSIDQLLAGLSAVIELDVSHISTYMLILEKNTKLYSQVKQGEVCVANEDESISQYEKVLKHLNSKGFLRYEISNFSLKDKECRHNLKYWSLGEYIGFGVSAHSYIDGKRFSNTESIDDYNKGKINVEYETLSTKEKYEEYIMLGLRTKSGINLELIKQEFSIDLLKVKQNEINFLLNYNLISLENGTITIKENKFGLCNQIILKLI